jgi:hypothetical protein
MADLAKCHQETCCLATSCRRFLATASERQSWILPLQTGQACSFYWPQAAPAEGAIPSG